MKHNFRFLKNYHSTSQLYSITRTAEKAFIFEQYATVALLSREISSQLAVQLAKQSYCFLPNISLNVDELIEKLYQFQIIDYELLTLFRQLRITGRHPKSVDRPTAYGLLVKLHYLMVWYTNIFFGGHEQPDNFKL